MKTLLLVPFALAAMSLPRVVHPVLPLGEHDWVVDPVHSSVVFRVMHANASWFQGTFDTIEGKVTLDPAKPEAGSVELAIPVDSIDTNDQKRDDHLKNADFFNSKENPRITFKSTKIAKADGGKFAVDGELELAGAKKPIRLVVEKTGEGEFHGRRAGYLAEFSIRRSDFGMDYGVAQKALGDEVELTIALELLQPK